MKELKQSKSESERSSPDCIECEVFLKSKGLDPEILVLDDYYSSRINIRSGHWSDLTKEIGIRCDFIREFGFAILSKKGIEAIRPYAPIVEIGAGSGYWSYELQRHGVDVVATDTKDGKYGFFHETGLKIGRWEKPYSEIETLNSVEAVRKYPNHTILTVWPDLGEPWAADALDIYTGHTVIYMGEGMGNACADDRFHEILDKRFSDQDYVPMPHFWASYDRCLRICREPKMLTGR